MENVDALDRFLLALKIDQAFRFASFVWRNMATTRNWPDLVLLRLGIKKSVNAKFRDATSIDDVTMSNYVIYRNAQEARLIKANVSSDGTVSITYKGKNIRLKGPTAPFALSEIFISEEYQKISPSGKVVVDIGASIGDTAIYFSINGASHIYSFEPYPSTFRLALQNVETNGVASKVSLINAAVGPNNGKLKIDPKAQNFGGSDVKEAEDGMEIPVITLREIIESYNLSDAILKIDCEGAEYGILLKADNALLRKFSEIILEYHYGYSDLKRKLESAGFDVSKLGAPSLVFNAYVSKPRMVVGILYATRR